MNCSQECPLFSRSTEKLAELSGQMNCFNKAEVTLKDAPTEEPSIIEAIRPIKQKGKRKDDLSKLSKRTEKHELTEDELREIYGENGWKRLPDEVFSRVEYTPDVKEVVERHVVVYAGKKVDRIVKAERSVDLLRNSIATPSLVAAIMNH